MSNQSDESAQGDKSDESPEPEWVRVAQLARKLDVDPGVLYREIRSGTLRAVRVGRAVRISRAAADDYIRLCEQRARGAD